MSTSPQIVPFTNAQNQTFEVPLQIDGTVKTLQGVLRFNEVGGFWVLSLSDSAGTLILDSLPLLTGNGSGPEASGNMLGQFAYLNIGSLYVINASGVASPDYPNQSDLGTDFFVLWDNTPTDIPPSQGVETFSGFVNVVSPLGGRADVTWVSGDKFIVGGAWAGLPISINGSLFSVAYVGTPTYLQLTSIGLPTLTNVPYLLG